MCGRYASTKSTNDLVSLFDAERPPDKEMVASSYNVAPTDGVAAVAAHRPKDSDEPARRQLRVLKWGLVPYWAKDPAIGNRMINARADSLLTKPAFKRAAAKRRCLIPADGWFEWQHNPDRPGKQPFYMTPRDGSELAFAGLWEYWRHEDEQILSCAIITTDAIGQLADIHPRMPLALPRERWAAWLDLDREDPTELLDPDQQLIDGLELRPIRKAVGNVHNNNPALLERIAV
jgi:putative SOS response-associated peptidase YedK